MVHSENQCGRCDGFPANTTYSAKASQCTCSVGYFVNSAVNLEMLRRVWFKLNVEDHPLSADYSESLSIFSESYNTEMSGDISSLRTNALVCLPCPPNLVCSGNMNPPLSASALFSARNTTSLFYGVLPVGAGSTQWWVQCPTIRMHNRPDRGIVILSVFILFPYIKGVVTAKYIAALTSFYEFPSASAD